MANEASIFAKNLLNKSFQNNASDIHFHPLPNNDKVSIFFRILGKRKLITEISAEFYQTLLTFFKFSAEMDIGETRRPQDGSLHWYSPTDKTVYDLRLSTLPANNLESLTIRIFPQNNAPSLKELFLFPFQLNQMREWLKYDSGMILFTGPTGSGKSTMMYALLEELIKTQSSQVITLEEPIERVIDNILQVEVNEKAGMTYQAGLKAALRHDPDVILIGEIRDEKTAKFAFRAALTGHLIFTTLHAKNALGTIARLLDLGIKRIELQQALIAVASLQLVPIIVKGMESRRAAITEVLDGLTLQQVILGEDISDKQFKTFTELKEKAYRYGFINEKTYKETF